MSTTPPVVTVMPLVPAKPTAVVSLKKTLDQNTLASIKLQFETESGLKEGLIEIAKELQRHSQQGIHSLHSGNFEDGTASVKQAAEFAKTLTNKFDANPKETKFARGHGLIQNSLSDFVAARCLHHFFEAGTLLSHKDLQGVKDSEYLTGVIQFCQDLGRYAVSQATIGQAGSVLLCKNLVEVVFGKLLEFDFRNGPLRRKYDGVKYALKRLQDILYELSLTDAYVSEDRVDVADQQDAKKRKLDTADDADTPAAAATSSLVQADDFDKIRTTMEEYDAKRENVIKQTRDVQKLSKKAIFGLHRGEFKEVQKQLDQAAKQAETIFETFVKDEPDLRYGSYANCLEEFGEAVLYKVWLERGELCDRDGADMKGLLNTSEYLGALVDFTGEVGRFAVSAASKRDQDAVRNSLSSMLAVQSGLFFIGSVAKNALSKKEAALATNVKKMEHLLYELSLVKASGREISAAKTEETTE